MFSTRIAVPLAVAAVLFVTACTGTEATPEPTEVPTSAPLLETPVSQGSNAEDITTEPDHLYEGTEGNPWWNDTVFYELFLRSFNDSDGDGVGDINGLIEKLDYLNDGDPNTTDDLGVTGIWLMPVMESPSYHGYDVVDYFKVDEEYGSEEDFQRLIEEAHARGIRVVVDLVLNHTSTEHPWFQESRDPDSELRNWYVWEDENPGYTGPWGQRVWHKSDDDFYYGVFWEGMPDLNYKNPEVTEAAYEAARFWLDDMGVDGFRLDAIKHIVEEDSLQENTNATHDWMEGFYTFYKDVNPDAFAVGEAWTSTQQVLDYTGDEVDIAFQFDLAEDILNASRDGLGSLFTKELKGIVDSFPPGQYATFITNHDQNRVMSQLQGDAGAASVAASLLLTSPGVPFIYYGEEIGMKGEKPDEDIRLPMQWSSENNAAGFSDGRAWRPPAEDFQERNVDLQIGDPDSLLSHYRDLIHLRSQHEALRIGDWIPIDVEPGSLVAFLRHSDQETVLVLINPTRKNIDSFRLNLDEGPLGEDVTAELLFGQGSIISPVINQAGGFTDYVPLEALPPQSTFIIGLQSSP